MDESPQHGTLRNSIYRRTTQSQRRMTPARRLAHALAVPLIALLLRLWWSTCRVVHVVGEEHIDAVLARHPSFMPVYWHQHHIFCARYLLQAQQTRPLRIGFLISPSVDGELGARLVRRLGGAVVRGSSTNTGAQAFKDYFNALIREKISPIINPDGPRGPRFRCKPGVVLLAQMSARPLLPLAYCATRARLIAWDKFVLPLPFCRIAIAVGAPLSVPRVLDAAGLQRLQADVERALHDTFRAARAALAQR
ncbi:MAG: lysophospholipid acyltransferase family protein [Gammaproteobacteria bacterium]|nr:lysophospholipid acyltransferase family protein [Gammaproteobacteria bacterium]